MLLGMDFCSLASKRRQEKSNFIDTELPIRAKRKMSYVESLQYL